MLTQICLAFLWSESDILGEICPTWEYERWYTWSVLYVSYCMLTVVIWWCLCCYLLVVYRSSETSTNQSDIIIRSDDRFLNLVVDSDSIVSKIYMLKFVLWLFFFFFSLHTDKNIVVLSQLVVFALMLTNIWQFFPSVLLTLSQCTYLD